MDKNILTKTAIKVTKYIGVEVCETIMYSGGIYILVTAVSKRTSGLRHARKVAKLRGMKEGEMLDVFNVESGILGLVRRWLSDVSVYKVVSVKNGKYKMRYIGSRSYTSAELKEITNEVIT